MNHTRWKMFILTMAFAMIAMPALADTPTVNASPAPAQAEQCNPIDIQVNGATMPQVTTGVSATPATMVGTSFTKANDQMVNGTIDMANDTGATNEMIATQTMTANPFDGTGTNNETAFKQDVILLAAPF